MPSSSPFTWVDRVQQDHFDADLNQTIPSWRLRVKWLATGSVLTVWVPVANYTPDQVNAAILAAGAKDEAIEKLGKPAA